MPLLLKLALWTIVAFVWLWLGALAFTMPGGPPWPWRAGVLLPALAITFIAIQLSREP